MIVELARTVRSYAAGAIGDVLDNLWTLLLFHVGVYSLGAAVTTPLLAWAANRLVASSGRAAVSNFDILSFALSPRGVAFGVLLGAGFFTLRLVHESLILATLFSEQTGLVRRAGAIVDVVRAWRRLLPLGLAQFLVLLGTALPFLLLVLGAYALLPDEFDINYYLATMPAEFQRIVIVAGVVLAIGAVVVAVVFSLLAYATPYVLFEGDGPIRAIRRSIRTAWASRGRTIGVLAGHFLVCAGVVGAALGLAYVVQAIVLGAADDSLDAAVVAIALLLGLNALGAATIAFAAFATRTALVGALYRRATGRTHVAGVRAPASASRVRHAALAILLALVAVTTLATWRLMGELRVREAAMITAHRGASLVAPENTLPAFEAAIEAGADVIELDVQETLDGEVVVLHDEDLMRVAGDPRHVWALTLEELREVDVGRVFDPAFAGTRVPTLREAIAAVRGRAKLLIELKYNGHDENLAARVVSILQEEDFVDDVMIMSLEARGIEEVRSLAPEIPIGWTVAHSLGDVTRTDVDFLSLGSEGISGRLFARARATGKAVHVWTANSEEDLLRYLFLGVDNVITDDVEQAVRLRAERERMTLIERALISFRYRVD